MLTVWSPGLTGISNLSEAPPGRLRDATGHKIDFEPGIGTILDVPLENDTRSSRPNRLHLRRLTGDKLHLDLPRTQCGPECVDLMTPGHIRVLDGTLGRQFHRLTVDLQLAAVAILRRPVDCEFRLIGLRRAGAGLWLGPPSQDQCGRQRQADQGSRGPRDAPRPPSHRLRAEPAMRRRCGNVRSYRRRFRLSDRLDHPRQAQVFQCCRHHGGNTNLFRDGSAWHGWGSFQLGAGRAFSC